MNNLSSILSGRLLSFDAVVVIALIAASTFAEECTFENGDDWLLHRVLDFFKNESVTPVIWSKSTFTSIDGIAYEFLERHDAVGALRQRLLAHESSGQRSIVLLTVDGWCGLLTDPNPELPSYTAMFLLNTNTGLLSDDPWFPNQNLTIDERLDICSGLAKRKVTRRDVLNWLNSSELRALYVNQRTFQSHWKVKVIPIGIGPSHYQILLNRFGVEDIFSVLRNAASVPKRERPNLLGVSHSWCCGRTEIFNKINENFNGTLENHFCDPADEGDTDPTDQDNAECVRAYRDVLLTSKFCLSPRGLGSDCYRHWESLFCGCIPIMESGPLDKIFNGLPVVQVVDWTDVTPAFLKEKYFELKTRGFSWDIQRLSVQFYLHEISAHFLK